MNLADTIEHTALGSTVTPSQIEVLCREAAEHRLFGVCVSPRYVSLARRFLDGSPVRLVTVVGFPLGTSKTTVKIAEAREAIEDGAHEVDMVADLGAAKAGDLETVRTEVQQVKDAVGTATLKVILETGCFETAALRALAEAALRGGADFLKTSTGFGPRGASVSDVVLLCEVAKGRARVKASGGIRTTDAAKAMIAAGAARIGTSSGVALVRYVG